MSNATRDLFRRIAASRLSSSETTQPLQSTQAPQTQDSSADAPELRRIYSASENFLGKQMADLSRDVSDVNNLSDEEAAEIDKRIVLAIGTATRFINHWDNVSYELLRSQTSEETPRREQNARAVKVS